MNLPLLRGLVATASLIFSLAALDAHAARSQQQKPGARHVARRAATRSKPAAASPLGSLPRANARPAAKAKVKLTAKAKAKAKAPKSAARKRVTARRPLRTRTATHSRTSEQATGLWSLPIVHGLYTAVADPARALIGQLTASMAKYRLKRKEHNPFTNEMQTVALSQLDEVALGAEVVNQIIPTMGIPLSGRPMEQYLDGIVRRLVVSSGIDRMTPYRFKVHLVHTDQVNAFAAPGGQITVTTGILRHIKSEAHIATILAHEIGHVVARHGSQNLAREELVKELLLTLGLAAAGNPPAEGAVLQGAADFKSLMLSFSRTQENQSDGLAVRFLARAGYSGIGIEETAAFFAAHESGHGPIDESTADHPTAATRTNNLAAVAREVGLTRTGDHGADRFAINVTLPLGLGIF